MKFNTTIKSTIVALFTSVAIALVLGGSSTLAQPYVEGITGTSTTPQFNIFTGVPITGNESDFVRLRESNGDPTSSAATNQFINELNSACNVGDKFDIRSYVHNGASPNSNDNGNGSAVARNTTISLTASLGGGSDKFVFGSTISASNADSVNDTGFLNCGKNVQLKLVPNTVYSSAAGAWVSRTDTAVNGTMPIGSRNATSGDVWGCWDERVMVVYTVEIVEIPVEIPDPVYACEAPKLVLSGREATFSFSPVARNGATFKDATVYFKADGSTKQEITTNSINAAGKVVALYTYNDKAKSIVVTTTVRFNVNNDVKEVVCEGSAVLAAVTTPTVLPNTGAGSFAGLLAAVTVAGAVAHRTFVLKRI
jgi:hypothetical protein